MRNAIRYLAFPLLISAGTALSFWLAGRFELAVPMAASLVGAAVLLIIMALERVVPFRTDWLSRDGQFLHDLGHTAIGTGGGAALGDLLNSLWVGALAAWLSTTLASPLWPTSLPFPLQVVLVYLVADLGRYVQHRLHHRFDFLWRFHQLHHSTGQLTAIKASRSHLVERVLQQLFMFGPLLALGAPREVLWWFIVPNSFLGPFAHCNVDLRLGPLEYLLMGPANHRVHHSASLQQSNTNFSSALVVWDLVFGTWTNPHRHPVENVGIEGDTTPRTFLAQLFAPLGWR